MKLTWYGHSAFRVEAGGATILIDPFLVGNPSWGGGWEGVAQDVTHVLLTHGHDDHVGSSVDILKKSGAMLVANFEICMLLVGQGVSGDRINPGNIGGTVDCGGFTTTFVQALHSSSLSGEGGTNTYLGNPGGLVLHFPDDKTLYHMGDTDIFSDMALINELHEPKVGLVPIGDRFTMGGGSGGSCVPALLQVRHGRALPFRNLPVDRPVGRQVRGWHGRFRNRGGAAQGWRGHFRLNVVSAVPCPFKGCARRGARL